MEAYEFISGKLYSGTKNTGTTGRKCPTSVKVVDRSEKPLIVLSSLLPGDFFAKKALVASCNLENSSEIESTALLDTGATGYLFINPLIVRCMCNKLQIKLIRLSKPKTL